MKLHLDLLKADKNFRLLSQAQLICYFGAWFSHTGIFTLLIKLQAPIWAITISAALAYLPGMIISFFSGAFIDKFRAKPILFTVLLIECVSVLMLISINSLDMLWLLLTLIFIRMGANVIYFQVEMALLPKILTSSNLKLANEVHSTIWAISYTAGMSLSGIFIHYYGVDMAFLLDFMLYVCAIITLLGVNFPESTEQTKQKIKAMLKDGFIYLKQNKLIVHLMILHSFVGITAYDALIALLADFEYKNILSVSLVIGFTNASRAFALMIAPAILSKYLNKKSLLYIYLLQGSGIILWAFLQHNFYLGFIGMFCAGFFTSTLWSYTYTLLQRNCDNAYYGRVIAYTDIIFLSMSAITSLGIGFFYKHGLSLKNITILMGILFFVGAFYYYKVLNSYKIKS